jgi:hypothetical protein
LRNSSNILHLAAHSRYKDTDDECACDEGVINVTDIFRCPTVIFLSTHFRSSIPLPSSAFSIPF